MKFKDFQGPVLFSSTFKAMNLGEKNSSTFKDVREPCIPEIYKGCKILKLVTWPWPRPFQEQFVQADWQAGIAMVNLPTKFEVPTFSRYRDIKCIKNAQNRVVRGHPRPSAMSPFDTAHMISYSSLIKTMCLSCTVVEMWWVICRNLPTTTYPTCIWRPH